MSAPPADEVLRISSRQNAAVARYRAAARGDTPELILLDGPHLVSEALDAGVRVEHAMIAAESADTRPEIESIIKRLQERRTTVAVAAASVMAIVSPVRSPSAIVALAPRPASADTDLYHPYPSLLVIASDLQDPGNLGAIVRVAEAAGATGLLAAGASADPFGWKALRGSMGSALRLPIGASSGAAEAIAAARARGCGIVATIPAGGREPERATLTGSVALLIGGEGSGLDEALIGDADERVSIPMQPPVESLNAAVTAALILYEARRQRRARLA